ncbi:MAG: ABC transporter ATP-binding protein [Dehalococcoidia bacterium]|nr:ABC transporter ATP-binding protein [Dehalococcoidia bacterium]
MSKPEALRVQDLEVRFGEVRAVAGASLSLPGGEVLALLGPSGCGKTTLLRTIAGFERAASGEVWLDRELIESRSRTMAPHRRSVGLVFQDYALFPHKTVAQNIAYGVPRGVDSKARVRELLALAGLEGLEGRYPHQLSGGQQQRVAVLRSLAPRPRLLLLDEPFSNLDPALRAELRDEVVKLLRAEGVTAILVTHDRSDALTVADRVAVMQRGRILQCDTPDGLYFRPSSEAAAQFGGEVQYVPGLAKHDMVQTALGLAPLAGPECEGVCRVLIRPEWIVPCQGAGEAATVVSSRLEGHQVRYQLRLTDGRELTMLTASGLRFTDGMPINIRVHVPLPVFGAVSETIHS